MLYTQTDTTDIVVNLIYSIKILKKKYFDREKTEEKGEKTHREAVGNRGNKKATVRYCSLKL